MIELKILSNLNKHTIVVVKSVVKLIVKSTGNLIKNQFKIKTGQSDFDNQNQIFKKFFFN